MSNRSAWSEMRAAPLASISRDCNVYFSIISSKVGSFRTIGITESCKMKHAKILNYVQLLHSPFQLPAVWNRCSLYLFVIFAIPFSQTGSGNCFRSAARRPAAIVKTTFHADQTAKSIYNAHVTSRSTDQKYFATGTHAWW